MKILIGFAPNPANPRKIRWWPCCYAWWPDEFLGNFSKSIKHVFFNGRMAEKLYQKQVLPTLGQCFCYLEYQCLPSTSPAYASLKFEQKIEAWKVIKQHVVK